MSRLSIEDLCILLVEPSQTQRKIIVNKLMLAKVGRVDAMSSIQEALCFIMTQGIVPDLVISAMYFNDMTGLELIGKLRENPKYENIPFMLNSSEENLENLQDIMQAGVVAILPKPFNGPELQKALSASLDFIEPNQLDLDYLEPEDLTILVVDDSVLSRKHIIRLLNNIGITEISEAGNGREALLCLEVERYDCILTDYHMPYMDGNELIYNIRNRSNQKDIPVVIITTETDNARLEVVNQAGISAICHKPFDANNLRTLLKMIIE